MGKSEFGCWDRKQRVTKINYFFKEIGLLFKGSTSRPESDFSASPFQCMFPQMLLVRICVSHFFNKEATRKEKKWQKYHLPTTNKVSALQNSELASSLY